MDAECVQLSWLVNEIPLLSIFVPFCECNFFIFFLTHLASYSFLSFHFELKMSSPFKRSLKLDSVNSVNSARPLEPGGLSHLNTAEAEQGEVLRPHSMSQPAVQVLRSVTCKSLEKPSRSTAAPRNPSLCQANNFPKSKTLRDSSISSFSICPSLFPMVSIWNRISSRAGPEAAGDQILHLGGVDLLKSHLKWSSFARTNLCYKAGSFVSLK